VTALLYVNVQDGLTPLHIACKVKKNKSVVKVLLDGGAAASAPSDVDGMTPLHLACSWGVQGATRCLLAARANVNAVALVSGLVCFDVGGQWVSPLPVGFGLVTL
jgi:ankyrin repeat protein